MRGKNKSFLEDVFILFVVGILIFAIYSIFFSSDEKVESENNKIFTEKNIEEAPKEIVDEKQIEDELEKKEDEVISQSSKEIVETDLIPENKIVPETSKEDSIKKEIIEPKVIESSKPVVETNSDSTTNLTDEKAKIEAFYQTIREKINSNIDKSALKRGEYINIRLTLLKDGRYEQLTFMDGNKEYFELVKSSIYKAFPVVMPNEIKNNFPRYFRMKIEF